MKMMSGANEKNDKIKKKMDDETNVKPKLKRQDFVEGVQRNTR